MNKSALINAAQSLAAAGMQIPEGAEGAAVVARLLVAGLVEQGVELTVAWDHVFGEGAYQKLSDEIFAANN